MGYFSRALDNLPKACEDIGVTEKRLQEDVETVKEWLRLQPHLPNVENSLIVENMVLRSKGSVELAKKSLELFFTFRQVYPELFGSYDPCSFEDKLCDELRTVMLLPGRTSTGHRVVLMDFPAPDSKLERCMFRITFKKCIMQADLLISEDIGCGVIFLYDARNLTVALSTMLLKDVVFGQKAMRCFFSGYKSRVKAIHFLQPPPTIDTVLKVAHIILPKKVAGRIFCHPDFASLHQHLEKEILPKDLGGDQKSVLELAADWRKEEISYRQWLVDRQKIWKTDETKRPPGNKVSCPELDTFGVNGSFKKLEFD